MSQGLGRLRILMVIFALSITMVLALYSSALAATGIISGSVVNVRSGPGINYTVDGNLLKDTEVQKNFLKECVPIPSKPK
jgi:uncharacterized protein YgiM (DUF1202 family)